MSHNSDSRYYTVIPLKLMSSLIVNVVNELECDIGVDDASDIWGEPGTRRLDRTLQVIADLYVDHPGSRDEICHEIKRIPDTWPLVLYVRRVSLLIKTSDDQRSFNRGLAVAAILDGRCDYRDMIVSLVILRAAADSAGLDSGTSFDAALDWSSSQVHSVLRNAKNHSQPDIESTIAAFGPSR